MVLVKESAEEAEHFPPEEEHRPEEEEEEEEEQTAEEGSEGSKAAKPEEEDEEEEEEEEEVKGGETRDLKKKKGKMEPSSSPSTPASASSLRPTRERKSVDRFYAVSPPISSAAKPLSIQKGRGMELKDIPNVAYKLSKRKPDENLQILHTILYGKKAKARNLKKNIGQFSGYAWAEDELEKQRGRLRDKFDKCVKEKLLDFCDLLNVPAYKSSTKKEELTLKLLEFLESPHITTDKLLSDKEKKRKNQRGKVTKTKRSIDTTADSPAKKPEGKAGRKRKQSSEKEDAESSPPRSESEEEEDDDANDKKDQKGTISEDDDMELEVAEESSKEDHNSPTKDYGTSTQDKDISVKPSKISDKSTKESSSSTLKRNNDPSTNPEVDISKRQKTATDSGGEDKNASAAEKASLKKKLSGKEKNAKVEKPEPSKEDIYAAAVNILKGANFDTATLNDIIRQLGCQFGVDFKPRKAEVKAIITEAINDMSCDEEEEDGDDESAELES